MSSEGNFQIRFLRKENKFLCADHVIRNKHGFGNFNYNWRLVILLDRPYYNTAGKLINVIETHTQKLTHLSVCSLMLISVINDLDVCYVQKYYFGNELSSH